MRTIAPKPSTGWRRLLIVGGGVQALCLASAVCWAAVARLDGGAVASGVVAVASSKKTIQHLEGGIVSEILVANGSVVRTGDPLVRLDSTRAEATVSLYKQQLAALLSQDARLVAERDASGEVDFPTYIHDLRGSPIVQQAVSDQLKGFQSRRTALKQQESILLSQIVQVQKEIEAIQVEHQTARSQISFVSRELEGIRILQAKQLIPLNRVTAMERDELSLKGQIARSSIESAKAEQRIIEARLKIAQLWHDYQQEAAKQLPEVRRAIGDLRQQIIIAEDAIRRISILAPIDGIVQEIKVFTIGGIVRPSDPIMVVVPSNDKLIVRAQFSPVDAERVQSGMNAEIRFPSFKQVSMKSVLGTVLNISSDRQVDDVTREPFFAAEVEIDRTTLPGEARERVNAGMPADVVVPTGERSVLAYLLSPLTDRIFKSMREQ